MMIKEIYSKIKSIVYKSKKVEPKEDKDSFLNFGLTLEDGIFVSNKESEYTLE